MSSNTMADLTQTQPSSGTTTGMTSIENPSVETHSTNHPDTSAAIVVGAAVASVAVICGLIFLLFFLFRRRRQNRRFHNQPDCQTSLQHVSRLDYLPPEPSPPPPPYKDIEGGFFEKDLETGFHPPVPPKEFGKPFVRVRRTSEDTYGEHKVEMVYEPYGLPAPQRTLDRAMF